MEKENTIRRIMKNEITWIISIIITVYAFFTQIVAPINDIQFQLAQINKDISELKGYDVRITKNSNSIIAIQTKLKIEKLDFQ